MASFETATAHLMRSLWWLDTWIFDQDSMTAKPNNTMMRMVSDPEMLQKATLNITIGAAIRGSTNQVRAISLVSARPAGLAGSTH